MKTLTQSDIQAVNGAGSITVKYTKGNESLEIKYQWD